MVSIWQAIRIKCFYVNDRCNFQHYTVQKVLLEDKYYSKIFALFKGKKLCKYMLMSFQNLDFKLKM